MKTIYLLVKDEALTKSRVELTRFPFTIGRHTDNSLMLAQPNVSRTHAKIDLIEGVYWLSDMGSKNGVLLNQNKITQEKLKSKDVFCIGSFTFEVHMDEVNANEFEEERTSQTNIDPGKKIRSILSRMQGKRLTVPDACEQFVTTLFEYLNLKKIQISVFKPQKYHLAMDQESGKDAQAIDLRSKLKNMQEIEKGYHQNDNDHVWAYNDGSLEFYVFINLLNPDSQTLDLCHWSFILLVNVLAQQSLHLEKVKTQEKLERIKSLLPEDVWKVEIGVDTLEASAHEVKEIKGTYMFCDIKGFTTLSEKLKPQEVVELLNGFFQKAVMAIQDHFGDVNKFIGDAIMAVFIKSSTEKDNALNAVKAGHAILKELSEFWPSVSSEKRFSVRIGINSGRSVIGKVGAYERMEYTVIGDEVNLASRIQGLCEPNQVTIGSYTAELVMNHFELKKISKVTVKGKSKPVDIYQVKIK